MSKVEAAMQPRPQRGPLSPAQPRSPGKERKAPFYMGCHLGVRHHEGGFCRSPEMMASRHTPDCAPLYTWPLRSAHDVARFHFLSFVHEPRDNFNPSPHAPPPKRSH